MRTVILHDVFDIIPKRWLKGDSLGKMVKNKQNQIDHR